MQHQVSLYLQGILISQASSSSFAKAADIAAETTLRDLIDIQAMFSVKELVNMYIGKSSPNSLLSLYLAKKSKQVPNLIELDSENYPPAGVTNLKFGVSSASDFLSNYSDLSYDK